MSIKTERAGIESVKEYWNRRPCNIRHSEKEVGSREYFDEVEARKYFVEPHIPRFAEFGRWTGRKVLEIGCGIGTDTINFARSGARVTAIDLSSESIAIASRRAEVFGVSDRIRFICGNAERLREILPPEKFDLIYSFGVIHHSPRPRNIIRELRSYVHSSTELKLMVYHRHSWKVLWILLTYGKGAFWRLKELIARHSEAQTGCPVTFSYTPSEAAELIKPFKLTRAAVDHIFPYCIPEYKNHKYKKEWFFRYLPQPLFRWLEQRWGWHLLISAVPPDHESNH